ncbi:MAG: O-antigen ligase family protein [Hyphomicrobiaceae bacterium]|nr:O-antigen ligase family protein [Hyphomicrobiaceae bacterium]
MPLSLFADVWLWVAIFSGCLVTFEPALYDMMLIPMAVFAFVMGLRIPRDQGPLVTLLLVFNLGGLLAMTQVEYNWDRAPTFVAISFFLALKCIYLAATMAENPHRMRVVMSAYVASAMVAALLGLAGYILKSDVLTLYGRAKGLFKDPNVFGPFLMLPALWVAREILVKGLAAGLWKIFALGVLFIGVFFSFSRAAWALYGFSLMFMGLFVFVNEQDQRKRLRLIIMFVGALGLLVAILAVILSIDEIRDLFFVRAKLVQDYDGARLGRFARHGIAFAAAMGLPLGIGPYEFMQYFDFPEDPHNVYLKSLMVYGWIGALAYYALVLWTLAKSFPIMFKNRPWSGLMQCVFIVLMGHNLISWIIDSDHWRHFYILWAFAWAIIAIDRREDRRRRAEPPAPTPPPPPRRAPVPHPAAGLARRVAAGPARR